MQGVFARFFASEGLSKVITEVFQNAQAHQGVPVELEDA